MSDYGGGVDSSLSGSRPDSLPIVMNFSQGHEAIRSEAATIAITATRWTSTNFFARSVRPP